MSWALQSPKPKTTSAVVTLIAIEIVMLIGKASIHGLGSVAMLSYQRLYPLLLVYIPVKIMISPLTCWFILPHSIPIKSQPSEVFTSSDDFVS